MILQSDASWVPARVGKLTASRMADAMNFIEDRSADYAPDGRQVKYVEALPKKLNEKFHYVVGEKPQKMKSGGDRNALLRDLLAERLVGSAKDHYVTVAMQWGLDHEDNAAAAYEAHTGNILRPGGFLDHPTIANFGATPDRLIGREGLLEIKCPTTETYVKWVLEGVVPDEHRPQMAAQLLCFKRRWCDFAAYDPRVPAGQQLFVRRFEPTPQYLAEVEQAAVAFLHDLDTMFDLFFRNIANAPTETARPDPGPAAAAAEEPVAVGT